MAPCRLLLVHILKSALIYLSKFLLFIFDRLWRLDVMLSVAGRIVEVMVCASGVPPSTLFEQASLGWTEQPTGTV